VATENDEEAAVNLPTIRWDLNIYNLFMIVTAGAVFYATTNHRLNVAEDNARKYIPVLEELVRKDSVKDTRIAQLTESQLDLRRLLNDQVVTQSKTNGEVLAQLSAIRETLAWFRATLENSSKHQQRVP